MRRVGGAERVVLGGISQGAAVGAWTLLCGRTGRLGGFVGASGWLPFASGIERLGRGEGESGFVDSMMARLWEDLVPPGGSKGVLDTPVFLGHGVDDGTVDVELGRETRRVLAALGMRVEWREYAGAELEGHWLKVPEEVDDIVRFLGKVAAGGDVGYVDD